MSFFSSSWWSSSRKPIRRRPSFVPRLLDLEERTLPSTFTVLNLSDSGPGSLRAEITAANANPGADVIAFAHGVTGAIALTSGELSIADSVKIKGPGADQLTVSGSNASRVFEIATGFDVTISGLTISKGKAADQGGGILNNGSNLTLSADALTNNVAFESTFVTARGGGLRNLGGNLIISGSTISGNQVLGADGLSAGGAASGGGVDIPAGNATITSTTITGNLAKGGGNSGDSAIGGQASGGGIASAAPLVITSSTVSDNQAIGGANSGATSGAGGGLNLSGGAAISGTTFSGNQAIGGNGGTGPFVGEAEGAAIATFGPNGGGTAAPVTVSGSTFVNNQAIGGNGGDSGPGNSDPSVDEAYGTIFNFGGVLNVNGTSFGHNKSIGGSNATATGTDIVEVGVAEGGVISNEIGSTATFAGCTFSDNQAIGGSGNTGSGPVVHAGSAFGAGIFSGFGGSGVGSNTLTVNNTTFTQNDATGGNDNSGTAGVFALVGDGAGGGIMNYLGGTTNVSGSKLDDGQASGGSGNTASGTGNGFAGLGAGGAIFNALSNYNSSGYGAFNASVVTVTKSTLVGNRAQGSNALGGAVYNGAGRASLQPIRPSKTTRRTPSTRASAAPLTTSAPW